MVHFILFSWTQEVIDSLEYELFSTHFHQFRVDFFSPSSSPLCLSALKGNFKSGGSQGRQRAQLARGGKFLLEFFNELAWLFLKEFP